jgi:hypothetical protein
MRERKGASPGAGNAKAREACNSHERTYVRTYIAIIGADDAKSTAVPHQP